ncbi:tRNA guanosine(34) transglycosylase Tgt [Candidatus Kaiserbacteria bacterium]|nr:tRNA guanosine(34) transglycosylase Tgt [Candidatus Kaiserbacteria bacterium]
MRPIRFEIEKKGPTSPHSSRKTRDGTAGLRRASKGLARAGVLHTPHGDIQTPAFVAVGTKATVKGIAPENFTELGMQGIIANTYHLYLSPGEDLIEKAGGIHAFMGYDGPIMTDSGGFQVFSLGEGFGKKISKFLAPSVVEAMPEHKAEEDVADSAAPSVWSEELATSHGKLAIIDDDGVTFTSHLDGSLHRFTPERSIEIQHKLGADIIYAFDECTSPTADYEYQREAMDRTHRWAKRSLAAHRMIEYENQKASLPFEAPQGRSRGIYGIVQGGRHEDLRVDSAKYLADMDFDGYGIGGSFTKEDILGILDLVNSELPEDKPRHLLGIGEPEDMFVGAAAGIDTFDCVVPTRKGRTGSVYTHEGAIIIRNAEFKEDFTSIDRECDCFVCKRFTRSYIHHLFRTGEMLGPVLATAHNIRFLTRVTENIREGILNDNLDEVRDAFMRRYKR